MIKPFKLSWISSFLIASLSVSLVSVISVISLQKVSFYEELFLKVDENKSHLLEVDSNLAYKLKINQKLSISFNEQKYDFKIQSIDNLEANKFQIKLKDQQRSLILLPNSFVKVKVKIHEYHIYELFIN